MNSKFIVNFFHEIDLFGKEPDLYFKGKSKKSYLIGIIFTIVYIIIYAGYFFYKMHRMINKYDVTFYETSAYTGEIPSIEVTNENFYGAFALKGENQQPFINPQIYYARAQYINGVKNEEGKWDYTGSRELILEPCKIEKFGNEYREFFKNDNLNNYYCISEINSTLRGYSTSDIFSYIYITIYACQNTTENNNWCYPMDIIDKFLSYNIFTINIEDIELTPQIYNSPVQRIRKDIIGPIYKKLYQQIYAYMQIVDIETDNNIIGFEVFQDIKKERYLKYESSWIISSPNDGKRYDEDITEPVCEITIQLAVNILTQKRTYTQLITVLGDVGGLMEFLHSIFNFFSALIVQILYEKSLVNNLFSFDTDRKVILLKSKKNIKTKNIINNDKIEANIYNLKKPINQISPQNSLNANDNLIPIKKNIIEDKIMNIKEDKKYKKIKKKKRISSKNTGIYSSIFEKSSNNEGTNQLFQKSNINEENNVKINNIKIFDNKEKEEKKEHLKEKEKENAKFIEINKIFIYLCFCCIRKRKNINIILLNECINIIIEKLDILNIFRKLHYDEIMQAKSTSFKEDTIVISDICRQRLQNLQKITKFLKLKYHD